VRRRLPLRLPDAATQGCVPHAIALVTGCETGRKCHTPLTPRRPVAQAGIPDEAWFCKGCLEKFGDAGPPAWTAFGPGDRCVATFEEDKTPGSQAKWVCKVLDIQGTTALVHFPGWKDKHDLWVERSTLEELPAEEVLARAQRSRLLTEAEEQKRLQDIEKERQAQEVVETEIKMGELEGEKKKLHKLIQAEKAKVKPSTGTAMATASNKASKAGSGGGEGRKGALAEGGVKEQEEEGDSGGRKGSEELAKLLARLKDVGEQIKDLRRSLPRKHESYLPPVNATGDQGERSNGGKRGRGGKEGAGPGVAPGFASRVTTLDDEGGDGWNDYCLECGSGEGELICCDACPRAFCLACARLAKAPRGNWFCKPCTNAKQMLATGGGIGSDKLLLQIQRLCEQFPMTHFLGLLAFDLARVRTSAEYCRELGISLNGMHEVATAKEALEKLDSLLEAANAQDSAGETKGEGSGARAGAEGCSSDVSEARSAPAPGPASTRGAAAAEKRGKDGVGQGSDALGGAGQAGKASSGAGDGGRAVRAGATGGSGSKKHQAASAMSGMALADARYKKFEEVVTRYRRCPCAPPLDGVRVRVAPRLPRTADAADKWCWAGSTRMACACRTSASPRGRSRPAKRPSSATTMTSSSPSSKSSCRHKLAPSHALASRRPLWRPRLPRLVSML